MLSDALTILCGHRFQPMPRRSRAEIDTPPVRLVAPRLSRRLLGAGRPCRGGALRPRVGHRLFRRRARSGHARRQRGSPAPAGSRWWGRGRSRSKARPSAPSSSPSARWTWSGSSPTAGGWSRPRKPTGSSTRRRPARPSSCRRDGGLETLLLLVAGPQESGGS